MLQKTISAPIRAVIFDLDGTLLDTLSDIASATNQALKEMGLPTHPEEKFREFVGSGAAVLMQRATPPGTNETQLATLLAGFEHHYRQQGHATTRPYSGIESMLDSLVSQQCGLAVLSNKPHHFTQQCMAQHFATRPFLSILGQRDTVPKKPDPSGLFEILQTHDWHTDACLYVGDTNIDMQTGRAAGVYTVGVSWGFRSVDELQQAAADVIVHQPSEIAELVSMSR